MIRTIGSSLPTFKTITFGLGLNIVLADVAEGTTERHTRNSAGKTSLVEVVHFLLGSDPEKNSLFRVPTHVNHTFSMEVMAAGRWITAVRTGHPDRDRRIYLPDLDLGVGLVPEQDEDGENYVTLEAWRAFLGEQWFDIPAKREGTPFEGRNAPTFRQLIGYFARRRKDSGLETIEKIARDQQSGSWQVAVSYLLGLDWQTAREIQFLRERRKLAGSLRKAIRDSELGDLFGTTAEIRPELARTEERIGVVRTQVSTFQVHDQYRELASRASGLKDRMTSLTLDLAEAESARTYMRRALEQEEPPAYSDLQRLYSAAGVELPGFALRRFDEVKAFQASVAANRRGYLERQIADTEAWRTGAERELGETSADRTRILRELDGRGAFEDLMALRERLGELSGRAETLRAKLQNAAALESSETQLKAEAAELELKLLQSFEAHEDEIKRATVLVDHAITSLYDDRTGNLIIEASRSGPKFRIDIQGGGNKGGIDMMKLFCFDTALLRIAFDRFRPGPRFLLHDSHLFDPVDSRQMGQALAFGGALADEIGGQYIVALNSDDFSAADKASEGLLGRFVNPVRLADDETGGLFGHRFDLGE